MPSSFVKSGFEAASRCALTGLKSAHSTSRKKTQLMAYQIHLSLLSPRSDAIRPVAIISTSAPSTQPIRPLRARAASPPPVNGASPTVSRPSRSSGVVTTQSTYRA